MVDWSLLPRDGQLLSKQNFALPGCPDNPKFLLTGPALHYTKLVGLSTLLAWALIHLKTIFYRGSVPGGSTTEGDGGDPGILSIFNRGSSAS